MLAAVAVGKGLAGRKGRREGGELVDEFFRGEMARSFEARQVVIGLDAAGVREQMPDGDSFPRQRDFEIIRQRIIQPQLALVGQKENARSSELFCGGANLEDRFRGYRYTPFQVRRAVSFL